MPAVVVGEIAHHPNAGTVQLDDGGDALGGPEPQHGHLRWRRYRIAVERDDPEGVAGQSEAAISPALAFNTWNSTRSPCFTRIGSPWPSIFPLIPKQLVANLVAFGPFELLFSLLPDFLQFLDRSADKHVHGHVAASAERRPEFLQHQKNFVAINAWIVHRLDVDRTRLAAVGRRGSDRSWERRGYGKSGNPRVSARKRYGSYCAAE